MKRSVADWFDEGDHALKEEVSWLLSGDYRRVGAFVTSGIRREGVKSVLEFSCRSGLLARSLEILEPGLTYQGVEGSRRLVSMAKKRAEEIRQDRLQFFHDSLWSSPNGDVRDLVVFFSHMKHVLLESWSAVFARLLGLGRNAAFDLQLLDHDLDNGVEFPHTYVTEQRLVAALAAAGHEEVLRETWGEHPVPDHGHMRNVALWTRRKPST